jgi:hypothetical protein
MAVDVVFDGHDAFGHLAVTANGVMVLDQDIPQVAAPLAAALT